MHSFTIWTCGAHKWRIIETPHQVASQSSTQGEMRNTVREGDAFRNWVRPPILENMQLIFADFNISFTFIGYLTLFCIQLQLVPINIGTRISVWIGSFYIIKGASQTCFYWPYKHGLWIHQLRVTTGQGDWETWLQGEVARNTCPSIYIQAWLGWG